MKVWDAKYSIYDGLRALPRRCYLCAMLILCDELRSLYENQLTISDQPLMTATLEVAQEAADHGGTLENASRALELETRWRRLLTEREDDARPGLWNTWVTFGLLAGEIAGVAPEYEATERIMLAATERWRDPNRRGVRRIDPAEEIDDDSPMAQTLRVFDQVVAVIARGRADDRCDPAEVRAQVIR